MARKQIPKIFINNKEYLSLTSASNVCGYHKERLRQLIQSNRIESQKVNGVWFIEKNILQNFIDKKTEMDSWDAFFETKI